MKVDGLVAYVTLSVGGYVLKSMIKSDVASGLRLKIGDTDPIRVQ
jgi:hypothetical protein